MICRFHSIKIAAIFRESTLNGLHFEKTWAVVQITVLRFKEHDE